MAKTTFFSGEEPTGVHYASFGGGTNIFVKCSKLTPHAASNIIMMKSHELEVSVMAPLLTEDDAFLSNPEAGFIVYRLPSVENLLGLPEKALD